MELIRSCQVFKTNFELSFALLAKSCFFLLFQVRVRRGLADLVTGVSSSSLLSNSPSAMWRSRH